MSLEGIVQQLTWLLLGATLVGMLARWARLSYPIALVAAGSLAAESRLVSLPQLEPDLVLFVFLPPLLFDASFRLDTRELRRLLPTTLLLAVPGVLFTAVVVGLTLALVLGLPLASGLLFGSLVAATDPVAVIGVFKDLRVSSRLTTIAEAESLINDGMAITLYISVIGLALTGTADAGGVVALFGKEVLGGVLIGGGLGFLFSYLTSKTEDHLLEMTQSAALAYGSYVVAQAVGASGALACVAAGLVHGDFGREIGMSETTRRLLDDLWEFLGFLANAVVFLLVGFSVDLGGLLAQAWPVTVAIVAVVASRAILIGLAALAVSRKKSVMSRAEYGVLAWGGLRGALTVALALALPLETPSRDLFVAMAFGVVLFTLLVQGVSLPLLIRWLRLAESA